MKRRKAGNPPGGGGGGGGTWKLAGDPDSDCTLTPHFSGSRRKASNARFCAPQAPPLVAALGWAGGGTPLQRLLQL